MNSFPGLRISDHNEQMFDDLRRHNLRHPGVVRAAVVKLFKLESVSIHQIAVARLEWLRLGLGDQKGVTRC